MNNELLKYKIENVKLNRKYYNLTKPSYDSIKQNLAYLLAQKLIDLDLVKINIKEFNPYNISNQSFFHNGVIPEVEIEIEINALKPYLNE